MLNFGQLHQGGQLRRRRHGFQCVLIVHLCITPFICSHCVLQLRTSPTVNELTFRSATAFYLHRLPLDLAKTSPHILIPERFALHLGTHLVSKYAHLKKAFITIEQLRWQRVPIAQGAGQTPKPHSHSFYRDGDEKRTVEAEVRFGHPLGCSIVHIYPRATNSSCT